MKLHEIYHDDIPDENQGGNCYMVSYQYFVRHHTPEMRLVHGLVSGQGPLKGIVFSHAWVEVNDTVIDLTSKLKHIPKDLYYAIGNIKTVFKYNHPQVMEKSIEYETYGPWEDVLINNRY